MLELKRLPVTRGNVPLRYAQGHFATNHSHINYYIDITFQKTRLSEAKAVAKELVKSFDATTVVDTILCLDGMEVVGTCLADELTRGGFQSINSHRTIYVITPEYNNSGLMLFRDNLKPMLKDKHVLVLMASMTTGYTIKKSIETVSFYGGYIAGVAAIYSAVKEAGGFPVASVYTLDDLPGYASYDCRDCPLCKQGIKLDALVNSYGYSEL